MTRGDRSRGDPEVVVITGASAGVGRATAREFARRGARIGLLARGRPGLEGARREVEELGGQALLIEGDVADPQTTERAASLVEEEFGPIDVWVNNAMATVFSPLRRLDPGEFRRVTDVTYLGFVYGTMAALRRMRPRNKGTIVQVGSALAYRGIPLQAPYCGAKHAIQGFTESVRCELLHERSRVWLTMVQLPALNTPQFRWQRTKLDRKAQPVPPIYQPEVAAKAIYWAAHHRRRQLFVGASTMITIHGNKVAPWLGDLYLARTGVDSQQYDGPPSPNRKDNLFEPVLEDWGAHGEFDERSKTRSYQLWLSMHRGAAAGAGVGALALTAALWRRLSPSV